MHIREPKLDNGATKLQLATTSAETALSAEDVKTYVPEVQSWLPLAAQTYQISPNIKDYVVVPVPIFPSDLPNRNSVAFPYEELMRFNPERGMPAYKSWRGMPTFAEHDHHDFRKAKGIVFDVYMRKMTDVAGDIYKVIALCGFDRTKDPALANAIASKKRTRYSMGASVNTYECSICGALSKPNSRDTECGHVQRGRFSIFETAHGKKPGYYLARGISGFEISSVATPAWVAAEENEVVFNLT